jgi:hypothetical protein
MTAPSITQTLDRLSLEVSTMEKNKQSAEAELKKKQDQHDRGFMDHLKTQLIAVLSGKIKGPGNTVRLQGTFKVRGEPREAFRLKIRTWGYPTRIQETEIEADLKWYLGTTLGPSYIIDRVEFDTVKNWWRGGVPGIYGEDGVISEDTFNCIVFLGTPLITRPLAALFDSLFPRVSVRVYFSRSVNE